MKELLLADRILLAKLRVCGSRGVFLNGRRGPRPRDQEKGGPRKGTKFRGPEQKARVKGCYAVTRSSG